MTTTQYRQASFQASNNQCIDPSEMDSWVDFGGLPSPANASSSKLSMSQAPSAIASPTNTLLALDGSDEHQTPVAPSYDYNRFKQQTGLPSGSLAKLTAINPDQSMFNNYNTGLDDFGLSTSMYDGMGSNSGLGAMTGEFGFESGITSPSMPAFFYPNDASQSEDFSIDPTTIQKQEEAQANIRYYPGMHQQAALKAQRQAQQQAQHQRQQAMLAQQQKQHEAEQQRSQGNSRRPSHVPVDSHAEETIARVVNQIRQSSSMSAGGDSPNSSSVLPHIIRSKKDEEEMDEDERLLNSEEGKKLSSKERRQLRNKVSARAFRSRRKEYIGQLEGELAVKSNEANDLKLQNRALMEENARFRALSEKLLAHSAFRPFLDEISRDPELSRSLSEISGTNRQSVTPTPQPTQKDTDPYSAGAQQYMPQQNLNQHVGMVMMPEPQIDFSALNLGGNNWALPNGMNNFQQHQVFAVLEVPEPAEPIDIAALSGKSGSSIVESFDEYSKYDHPTEIEAPELPKDQVVLAHDKENEVSATSASQFDENDPAYTLYANSSSSTVTAPVESPTAPTEKAAIHFALVVATDADIQCSSARLEKMVARMEASFTKLDAMMANFDV
jgi:hypothetical protein